MALLHESLGDIKSLNYNQINNMEQNIGNQLLYGYYKRKTSILEDLKKK